MSVAITSANINDPTVATVDRINDIINYIIDTTHNHITNPGTPDLNPPLSSAGNDPNMWIGQNLNLHPLKAYAGKYIRTSVLTPDISIDAYAGAPSPADSSAGSPAPAPAASSIQAADVAYILVADDGNYTKISSSIAISQGISSVTTPTPSFHASPESAALNAMILQTHNTPPVNAIIGATPPDAPVIVSVTNAFTSDTPIVNITFKRPNSLKPITQYSIIATSIDGAITIKNYPDPLVDLTTSGVDNLSFIARNFTAGYTYNIVITATSSVGPSVPSPYFAPSFIYCKPSPPTGVYGSIPLDQSGLPISRTINLYFTPAASNNGTQNITYTVTARGGASPITNTYNSVSIDTIGTYISISGLTNGTNYTFIIIANTVNGSSSPSTPSIPIMPVYVPDPITSISPSITPGGNGYITLTFPTPNNNGAAMSYTVTSETAGKDGGPVTSNQATVDATGTHIIITNLVPASSYIFVVTPSNTYGACLTSTTSPEITPYNPPGPITNITSSHTNCTVIFTFPSPTTGGATSLTYVVTSDTSPTTFSATDDRTNATVSINAINGQQLVNGRSYNFTITASNIAGSSFANASGIPVNIPAVTSPVYVPKANTGSGATLSANGSISFSTLSTGEPTTYTVHTNPVVMSNGSERVFNYTYPQNAADAATLATAPAAGSGSASLVPITINIDHLQVGCDYSYTIQAKNTVSTQNYPVETGNKSTAGIPDTPYPAINLPETSTSTWDRNKGALSIIPGNGSIKIRIGNSDGTGNFVAGALMNSDKYYYKVTTGVGGSAVTSPETLLSSSSQTLNSYPTAGGGTANFVNGINYTITVYAKSIAYPTYINGTIGSGTNTITGGSGVIVVTPVGPPLAPLKPTSATLITGISPQTSVLLTFTQIPATSNGGATVLGYIVKTSTNYYYYTTYGVGASAGTSTVTIPNLTPGNTYTFTMTGVNKSTTYKDASGHTTSVWDASHNIPVDPINWSPATTTAVVIPPLPAQPIVSLTSIAPTPGSTTTLNAVIGIAKGSASVPTNTPSSYTLANISPAVSGITTPLTITATAGAGTYTLAGLEEGRNYTINISATSAAGVGNPTSFSFQTCKQLTSGTLSAVNGDKATYTIVAPTSTQPFTTTYVATISPINSATPKETISLQSLSTTIYNITGLRSGIAYTIKITPTSTYTNSGSTTATTNKSVLLTGASANKNTGIPTVKTFTTVIKPTIGTITTTTTTTDTTASIPITTNYGTAMTFNATASSSDGGAASTGTPTSGNTISVATLSSGRKYTFIVTATDSNGYVSLPVTSVAVYTTPKPPTITAASASATSATVTVTNKGMYVGLGAITFTINATSSDSGTAKSVTAKFTITSGSTAPTISVPGLSSGKSYTFNATAKTDNSAQSTASSNTSPITLAGPVAVAPPVPVITVSINTTTHIATVTITNKSAYTAAMGPILFTVTGTSSDGGTTRTSPTGALSTFTGPTTVGPITVGATGALLSSGKHYTFTATAHSNTSGLTSAASAATASTVAGGSLEKTRSNRMKHKKTKKNKRSL